MRAAARIGLGAVGTAAALALALPGGAGAAALKAEGVLPPGQSGFVSTAGLPSGTGSPHLTDQISLFNDFEYKPRDRGTWSQSLAMGRD